MQIREPNPRHRLRRIWAYRQAIWALTTRHIRARFSKPLVGFTWMLVQPALLALVFAVFFGKLVRVPSDGLPYPVFVFTGFALWQGVSRSASEAGSAFDSAAPLLRQTPLPRLAPVLAIVAGASIDVIGALVIAFAFALSSGLWPGLPLLALPLILLVNLAVISGMAAALAGLCGAWRDLRQLVPLGLQVFMFASPVIYPVQLIPAQWQPVYFLNPFAGILTALRWSLLGGPAPNWGLCAISGSSAIFCAVMGVIIFQALEGRAADAI